MYDLAAYGAMIADSVRRRAYVEALESAVRPGSVVLEIGTGPGVFALLAARRGARKVYGVDPDDAVIVARQLAAANSLDGVVEFIQGLSTEIELPERADVVVSDLRGILPPYRQHLPSVIDARERLLVPGGILIPREDRLHAAIVSDPEVYRSRIRGWGDGEIDLDLRPTLAFVTNQVSKVRLVPDQCLSEPRSWTLIDYRTVTSADVAGRAGWELARGGEAHGLAVWFDTVLHDGIGFSNAPGEPELIYGQAFFPWPRPVTLAAGDRVDVELAANLVGDDYVWRWTTTIAGAGPPVRFEQSTFYGTPLSADRLRRRAASYVPQLGDDGSVARFVLDRINGRAPLEAIARELAAAFPERFKSWRRALTRVGDLAEKYG